MANAEREGNLKVEEDLTPEQWATIRAKRKEWLAIGLSTAPADFSTAEKAITKIYEAMDKKVPEFRHVTSPKEAVKLIKSQRTSGSSSSNVLYECFWGQQEAYWVAFYDVPREMGLVTYSDEDTERLAWWKDITLSSGWWWPYEEMCVISDRPELIATEYTDTERDVVRLHSATGPSVRYRDGWEIYSWHGRTVPKWVIADPSIQNIANEENTEIRRCAIEALGWDKFQEQAQLDLVDKCDDPGNPGNRIELYDVPRKYWGSPVRMILVNNGTVESDGVRRRFGITVPDSVTTALAAAAWTYDDPSSPVRMTPALYAKINRRT
jgi:hypothetical protein